MVEVFVHHGDLERTLRILRKKLQHEGIVRKTKIFYHEKPCTKRARKKAESRRRRRKLELKDQRYEV